MENFTKIQAMCSSNEDLTRILEKNLNLIKVVNENYDHIQDLEVLISLFKGGLTGYYKQYHPQDEEIVQFCAIVAENTRANHYRKVDKFDDVYTILAALKQQDLKNDCELLENELVIAKEELQNSGRSKPQFLIDDDEYQDQLELVWWEYEQREKIKSLEESIAHYKSIRPTINPVNSQGLRYVNEEVGFVDEDEEYY